MHIRPLVAAALTALCLSTASATTVLRLTPAEVESLAQRIIEGRCVEVRATSVGGPEHSMRATEYVFVVERVLKGEGLADRVSRDGGRLVVRQLGGSDAAGRSALIVGMPRYEAGMRYRLALNGESSLGLTSPVGLGQGVTRLPDLDAPTRPQP
jgi:hypothetical protein